MFGEVRMTQNIHGACGPPFRKADPALDAMLKSSLLVRRMAVGGGLHLGCLRADSIAGFRIFDTLPQGW